jgi:hypothetical protein
MTREIAKELQSMVEKFCATNDLQIEDIDVDIIGQEFKLVLETYQ